MTPNLRKKIETFLEIRKKEKKVAKGKLKTFQTQSLLNYRYLLIYHFVLSFTEKAICI